MNPLIENLSQSVTCHTTNDDDAHPAPSLASGLARIAAQWPDMLHYADTAQIEPLYHAGGWCWGVTVEAVGAKGSGE